ncbi:monocyte chemotactic protein 1B-like [Lycodopsis pacificus]
MASLSFLSLLLVTIMVSTASAQGGIASCCLKLSRTQVHREQLKSYYKQFKPSCPVHAVIFKTVKEKRICSDPENVWTKTSMAYLDGKDWQIQHATFTKHHRS